MKAIHWGLEHGPIASTAAVVPLEKNWSRIGLPSTRHFSAAGTASCAEATTVTGSTMRAPAGHGLRQQRPNHPDVNPRRWPPPRAPVAGVSLVIAGNQPAKPAPSAQTALPLLGGEQTWSTVTNSLDLGRRYVTDLIMHTRFGDSPRLLEESVSCSAHPLCLSRLGTGTDEAPMATIEKKCLPIRSPWSGRDVVRGRQGFAAWCTTDPKKTSPKTRQRMSLEGHR